ncbi:LysR family transcriptional regulator, partial [Escherichia coli]|nr:LysR family transcriptional regulator [Escherichia coli]
GISIVPPFVGLDYSDGQLVRRPVLPAMSMDVWLLTPSTRPPSLAAQQMSGVLRDALTQFDGAERH